MYATPCRDNAVVVSFETVSSRGAPADRMKAAVKTVIDLSNSALGRTAVDHIVIDEVWVERTLRSDIYTNEKVHVALSMPDDLRQAWYGLGAVNPSLDVGPGDGIPHDAFHWDKSQIEGIRLKRLEKIDKAIAAAAEPSMAHYGVSTILLIASIASFVLGSTPAAATFGASAAAIFLAAGLHPDFDGRPTYVGALHSRRPRLTALIYAANVVGLILPRLLARVPVYDAIPGVVAGLLPIAMIAAVAVTVARSSVEHLSRLRRQLDAAGAHLVPATDDVRSVGRSMDALLAICAVLPEQDRLTAAAAADRCRLAAGYSADGPATGAFDRSLETLDKVLASHRRASAYVVGDEAIPLARRVHEALVAAGDDAETLRVTLLAGETDSLDTLGRYLESRRRHDALSPVG